MNAASLPYYSDKLWLLGVQWSKRRESCNLEMHITPHYSADSQVTLRFQAIVTAVKLTFVSLSGSQFMTKLKHLLSHSQT